MTRSKRLQNRAAKTCHDAFLAGLLERKDLCCGCISYLDLPVKTKRQEEMSKRFYGCRDEHKDGFKMAPIQQSREERPQRRNSIDELFIREAANAQPQPIVTKKRPSQMEFELIKKPLEEAKRTIASEIPSLKEKISCLEQEKTNLKLELNQAVMEATTYKNNWRRSYRKVQSLRLTQDETVPDKVGAVMLRLMSESGLTEEQVIEGFLSTVCSRNKFASLLSHQKFQYTTRLKCTSLSGGSLDPGFA
jgi:hypothetical protein